MGKKRLVALRAYFANKKAKNLQEKASALELKKRKIHVRPTKELTEKDGNNKSIDADDAIATSNTDCDLDWEMIERAQNVQNEKNHTVTMIDEEDVDDDDNDDDDDDDDRIELDGNIEQSMEDYTFEFNDMKDIYAEGICTMLRTRSFVANPTEAYHLAKLIVSQTIVGTVVTSEAEQDSFAFASILSLEKCNRNAAVGGILSSLRHSTLQLNPSEELELLMKCIDGCHSAASGLLIHRRFSNLPLQLIGSLHENLVDDLAWAKQQLVDDDDHADSLLPAQKDSSSSHSTKSSNFFAQLQYILLLCEGKVTSPGNTKHTRTVTKDSSCCDLIASGLKNSVTFNYFEDEVYMQYASAAVLFRPSRQHSCVDDMVCILVPISKLNACMESIKRLLLV